MKKFLNTLILLILIFQLFIPKAFAGDHIKAGTTLTEDVYAFKIEEATDLMNKYYFYEQEYEKHLKLIEEYKKLDQIQQQKEINFESILETKELMISEYQKLKELDEERIKELNKQANASKIERWGFLAFGVGVSIGAILVADKINDSIEAPQNTNNPSNMARGITVFNF